MYRKFNNKNSRNFGRNKSASYEDIEVTDAKRPSKEGRVQVYLSNKALKGLPKSGSSITPKVDPYTQVLPSSAPYALLNSMNSIIGGTYGGLDNLDGGNIRQLITSEDSVFLHCYDSMAMYGTINYRYLPMVANDQKIGYGIADEMIKAIDEIQSLASATSYYALPINNYTIESSLPYSTKEADSKSLSLPGPFYEALICYQTILQMGAQVIQAFNKNRMNMGEMMRMSWDRETPKLNAYFGLLQKKSFLSNIKAVSYCLNGEYFDQEWLLQVAALVNITSRRSDALTEPLLEGNVVHDLPSTFKLMVSKDVNTVIFDMSKMDAHAKAMCNAHPEFEDYGYTFDSVNGMAIIWSQLLSIEDTLRWVRQYRRGKDVGTEQARFRMLSYIIEEFTYFYGIFKPAMADLRSALDVLRNSGVNKWGKIKGIGIVRETDNKILRNLTLEDLISSMFAGGDEMVFNSRTYRWSGHTPWNIYLGLPEYDAKSGGCFLSFSTKTLNVGDKNNPGNTLYIPRVFSNLGSLRALNRLGDERIIKSDAVDSSKIRSMARLKPLNSQSFKVRVPYIADSNGMENVDLSMLNWAMTKVLGIASFAAPSTATTAVTVESDILCYLTYEVEDITSEMITYARTHGPFVVNTLDDNTVGFLSFGK